MANTPFLRNEIPATTARLASLVQVQCSYGGYIPDLTQPNGFSAGSINWALVGGLQKATANTTRDAHERRELNYVNMGKIIEMVPGLVTFDVKFEYIYLYQASFLEACGFAGHTLEYQTRPLLFSLTLPSPNPSVIPYKTIVLLDCWIKDNPVEWQLTQKDDLRITQSVNIACGGIYEIPA